MKAGTAVQQQYVQDGDFFTTIDHESGLERCDPRLRLETNRHPATTKKPKRSVEGSGTLESRATSLGTVLKWDLHT